MTFELNQLVEIGWTSNNRRYKAVAKIIQVNSKSVRIKLYHHEAKPKQYDIYQSWTISTVKQTRDNYIKSLDTDQQINDIKDFNAEESRLNEIAEKAINQFWKNRIKQAEEQQKKEGVYKSGSTYVINEHGLSKVKDNWEISV